MMGRRDTLDYLQDMLDACDAALQFVQGMDSQAFRADQKTIFAVTRALEIIGEATKRVPQDVRDRYPAIPWRVMAGMRDQLIHNYINVDLDVVWEAVSRDVPALRPQVAAALAQERTRSSAAP